MQTGFGKHPPVVSKLLKVYKITAVYCILVATDGCFSRRLNCRNLLNRHTMGGKRSILMETVDE